jgi:hypothetical protein
MSQLEHERELSRLRVRRWRERHPEHVKELDRRNAKLRYQRNPQKFLEKTRRYRQAHPDRIRERDRRYRQAHPEKFALKSKEWQQRLREATLLHYGGNPPRCSCCGETIMEFLTIDHINGRKGTGHSRSFGGWRLYHWLKKHDFPDGYRVLCYNCNCSQARTKVCPHAKLKASPMVMSN